MKVFLDVGAHEGQTLTEVIRHGFDRIYAFEPMPAQYETLTERFRDYPEVELLDYGLAGETALLTMYGTNESMEASLYADKDDVDATARTRCRFVAASEFAREYLRAEDMVVVKLNCEGAEVAILGDLLDTGECRKVDHLLVDFDVRKIPSLRFQRWPLVSRLTAEGIPFDCAEDLVHLGHTHQERIGRWLGMVGGY